MTQDSKNTVMEELRQSVASLLHPDFSGLQAEIESLQEQLRQIESLSNPLPEELNKLQEGLQRLLARTGVVEQNVSNLQDNLADPQKVSNLIKLGLHPALQQSIGEDPYLYGEAIAPVISPAIRNQIRNSREEMIAALSPIIGQTISKAIADTFQDFQRRIDAQLKQNLNFRQRIQRLVARLRGVSETEMMIRESLPYTITQVFLIQCQTGLLLKQVSHSAEQQDMDIISSMLTAIRDFAHDALGQEDHELEEIQYGNSQILLKTGQYVYLAVVIEGIRPPGYVDLLGRIVYELNIKYENVLRKFQGDMDSLPDFSPDLMPLLDPRAENLDINSPPTELSQVQKTALWSCIGGLVLFVALATFACIFSIRLIPLAFPGPTLTPMPPTLSATKTPLPTPTVTPTLPAMPTQTATLLPSMTSTSTPSVTATPMVYFGVMTGNVWVHQDPDPASNRYPGAVTINTKVELHAVYKGWVKISWTTAFGYQEGWVPLDYVGITYPLPKQLITPIN